MTIWIVDDTQSWRASVEGIIKSVGANIGVVQFRRAQEALDALNRCAPNRLPNVIILDRNLGADVGDLSIGENVVTQIRSHPKYHKIIIIAHSSIAHCGEDMVAAGATIAIPKSHPEQLTEYLKEISCQKSENSNGK